MECSPTSFETNTIAESSSLKIKERSALDSLYKVTSFSWIAEGILRSSFRWIWAIKPNVSTRIEKPVVLFRAEVKGIQKDSGILQVISINNEVINNPDFFFFAYKENGNIPIKS